MKKFIKCLMIALILPLAFVFVGCGDTDGAVSIKDIKRTGGTDRVSEYTIIYTNGETDKFTIVNGEDGENLYNNITINDLYEQVKPSKPAGYSLIDFINEYLDIKLDTNAVASATALRSAISIYVEHSISIPDYNNIISYTQTAFGPQANYGVKNSIAWGAGAGVIYSLDAAKGDAYIITNYHVCANSASLAADGIATKFTCYAYGAESIDLNDLVKLSYYNNNCKEYGDLFKYDANGLPIINYGYGAIEAEYVGGSSQYDIAVLKVTNSEVLKNSAYRAVEVQDSDLVAAGSTAIAVGNPDACGIAVTNGVISVDSEYIQVEIDGTGVVLREFRIDTPVNAGNSGGGLFDNFGRLVGIVNAKTTDTATENMSYAIPGNVATRVAQSIIDNCDGVDRKTRRVLIGLSVVATDSEAKYNAETGLIEVTEEVSIALIEPDSLAYKIGLQVDDVITSVEISRGGNNILVVTDRTFKLVDAMLLAREGDSVVFNYTRGGVASTVATPILTADNFIDIE